MTKRTFTAIADPHSRALVNALFCSEAPPAEEYKNGMFELGKTLGLSICSQLPKNLERICLACTVEDADFLARGMLTVFEQDKMDVSFACFWNEKSIDAWGMDDFDIAPILRSYKEPLPRECVLVIVKSIISGGCVVATNLINLIGDTNPIDIYVVAPVMVKGAQQKLQNHFSKELLERFKYLNLALDDDRGSGKSIYERYGWTGSVDKNNFVPELVRQRRKRFAAKRSGT